MEDKNNSKRAKRIQMIGSVIAFLVTLMLVVNFFMPGIGKTEDDTIKTYNEFMAMVKDGQIAEVNYDSSSSYILFTLEGDDTKTLYQTDNPRDSKFKREMLEYDVVVNEVQFESGFWSMAGSIFLLVLQYGLMMAMFMIIFKKMQGGTDEMTIQTSSTNKFADVAGLEEVKESLLTTVDMLKNPRKYQQAGARISKGVLLSGPPGTGKTLLARAVAGEAGVNFIAVTGSDFDNKYVGVGADKVRKIFAQAKKQAPCILFIDEIDAIGCRRADTDNSYSRQTINQLLGCMDGFDASSGIFVFAATNAPESLDPALLRPGRFDSCFTVGLPDTAKDREDIIKLYLKNKKIDQTVSIPTLAKQTIGCSPAAIEAMINEAAIESVKNGGIINQTNIDDAFYRQLMNGHKKKKWERDENEIKTVAWHESGHALVGYLQNQEVSKISIVPTTSGAGGVTIFNQKKMGMYSKAEMEDHIRTMYAGRNAEILLNGEDKITTGASNDIAQATRSIKHMVSVYGMSKYGLLNLEELKVPASELISEYQTISKRLENECYQLLADHKDMLIKLADTLIEKETLEEAEVLALFAEFDSQRSDNTENENATDEVKSDD